MRFRWLLLLIALLTLPGRAGVDYYDLAVSPDGRCRLYLVAYSLLEPTLSMISPGQHWSRSHPSPDAAAIANDGHCVLAMPHALEYLDGEGRLVRSYPTPWLGFRARALWMESGKCYVELTSGEVESYALASGERQSVPVTAAFLAACPERAIALRLAVIHHLNLPWARQSLRSSDPAEVVNAKAYLFQRGHRQYAPELADGTVWQALVQGDRYRGSHAEVIVPGLLSEAPYLRRLPDEGAARVLGDLRSTAAVKPLLLQATQGPDREAAVEALVKILGPSAAPRAARSAAT